jgi:hypothetical protein
VVYDDSHKLLAIVLRIEYATVFFFEALTITLKNTHYYCVGSGNFI